MLIYGWLKQLFPGIEFQMQYVISQNNVSNLAGKVEAVSNILPFLLECKNEIEVAQHIKTLAQRLTIDEGLIMSEYRKLSRKNDRGEAVSKWQIQPNVLSTEDLAEQLLLYVILKNTDLRLFTEIKLIVSVLCQNFAEKSMKDC